MITHGMPMRNHFLETIRMLPYIIPYTKERGFRIIPVKQLQHFRRNLRHRPVIESKVYRLILAWNTELETAGEYPSDEVKVS